MLDVGRAAVAWALVVGLPGWLVCDALRHGAGRARNFALAPAVGVGVVYLAAHGIELIGLPVEAGTVLPLCLALGGGLQLAIGRVTVGRIRSWRFSAPTWFDVLSLVCAFAVGGVIWSAALRHAGVLPNTDGAHHALFASRIQALHSVDPGRITSSDGVAPSGYYPLAIHIAAALVDSVSGVSAGISLTVGLALATAVVLPAGVFVLVRRLDRGARTVAGIAAIIAVLFTWFPYSPMMWGGLPTVVGMCLIPGVVEGLWPRQGDGSRVAVGVCVGIAALGLFQAHNPQLVAAAATAFVLVLADGGLRRGVRGTTLAVWSVSAVTVAVTSVSAITATLGISTSIDGATLVGGNARMSGKPSPFFADSGIAMIEKVLSPPVLVLSILGLVICSLDKRCRGVGLAFLLWTTLLVGTALHAPVFAALSTPWYQAALRVSYYLALPLVIWAAVGLGKLADGADWALRRMSRGRPLRAGAGAGTALLLAVTVALQAPSALAATRDIYRHADLIGSDQLAAFSWLRAHVANGSSVLNTFDDGSGWMGVLGYAQPLFATKPEQGGPQVWGDRWHLLTHAGALATDAIDQSVVRTRRVEFAYTDSRHFPGTPPLAFTAETLESSPAYALAWSRGTVKIFRILSART